MLFILSINYKDDIGDITPLDQEEGARTVSVTSNQRNGERKSSLRTGKKKEGNLADSRNGSSMMEGVGTATQRQFTWRAMVTVL